MNTDDRRTGIKEYITLCASQDGNGAEYNFNILYESGSGASSMVYDAYCEELGRGVLKEFYPMTYADSFRRDSSGQLYITGRERLILTERERYLKPTKLLAEHKLSSGELATFIPVTSVLYGKGDSRTVYIWNPESMVKPFDSICREMRDSLDTAPAEKLSALLRVIRQLAACVSELHKCGLLHRDIKPENFGIKQRGGELLDQSVTMFDINSVCAAGDRSDICCTAGYDAPELESQGGNTPLTDIYAIGAVLFHAVIVTEETKKNGHKYDCSFYKNLKAMTDTSAFITACENSSHPRFRRMLTHILQKALAPDPDKRYRSCETLKKDMDSLLGFLSFDSEKENAYAGEESRRIKNSALSIMYHLYSYPLYRRSEAELTLDYFDEDEIKVIIIGLGGYGQNFLDAALQLGQMYGKKLTVRVYNDDSSDREIYLSDRPALREFFDLDGEAVEDSYGDIYFDTSFHLDRHSPAASLRPIFEREKNISCVFIAVGDDELNLRAADGAERLAPYAHICYACEKETGDERAVCVYRSIEGADIHKDTERMAFANHLLWNRSPNADRRGIYEEFMHPYNHDACIASVTAMKYRLFAMGIDMDELDCERAAEEFTKRYSRFYRAQLSAFEHRRWVTEKICKGWICERDITSAVRENRLKNEPERKHICILRSSSRLSDPSIWEEKDLSSLDELDRLSVTVHREYVKYAEELKRESGAMTALLLAIREDIRGDGKALSAFNEWYACIKNIREGDRQAYRLYAGLSDSFLAALPQGSEEVRRKTEDLMHSFRPIYEAGSFKDYKKEDEQIIDHIPFILTYSPDEAIVIPLCRGSRERELENTAAAAVIDPAYITYIDSISGEETDSLFNAAEFINGFMDRRNMECIVSLYITCPENMAQNERNDIKNRLEEIFGERGENVTVSSEPFSFDGVSPVMKNSSPLCNMLEKKGIYKRCPAFSYSIEAERFENIARCKKYSYISRIHYLTAEDMGFPADRSSQPELYEEHRELYDIYRLSKESYKGLCRRLKEHMHNTDIIGTLSKNSGEQGGRLSFILPVRCRTAVRGILKTLSDNGFIGEYTDSSLSIDSFRPEFEDIYGNQKAFEHIFSQVYVLPEAYAVTEKDNARIMYDNLICGKLSVSNEERGILESLGDKGYITGLEVSENCEASFTFASRKLKRLLTDENGAEMAYVYHSARKNGCDDAAVSEDGSCCMITKGYMSELVYCGSEWEYKGYAHKVITTEEYISSQQSI